MFFLASYKEPEWSSAAFSGNSGLKVTHFSWRKIMRSIDVYYITEKIRNWLRAG